MQHLPLQQSPGSHPGSASETRKRTQSTAFTKGTTGRVQPHHKDTRRGGSCAGVTLRSLSSSSHFCNSSNCHAVIQHAVLQYPALQPPSWSRGVSSSVTQSLRAVLATTSRANSPVLPCDHPKDVGGKLEAICTPLTFISPPLKVFTPLPTCCYKQSH